MTHYTSYTHQYLQVSTLVYYLYSPPSIIHYTTYVYMSCEGSYKYHLVIQLLRHQHYIYTSHTSYLLLREHHNTYLPLVLTTPNSNIPLPIPSNTTSVLVVLIPSIPSIIGGAIGYLGIYLLCSISYSPPSIIHYTTYVYMSCEGSY